MVSLWWQNSCWRQRLCKPKREHLFWPIDVGSCFKPHMTQFKAKPIPSQTDHPCMGYISDYIYVWYMMPIHMDLVLTTPTDRQISQSHGVFGHFVGSLLSGFCPKMLLRLFINSHRVDERSRIHFLPLRALNMRCTCERMPRDPLMHLRRLRSLAKWSDRKKWNRSSISWSGDLFDSFWWCKGCMDIERFWVNTSTSFWWGRSAALILAGWPVKKKKTPTR